MGRKFALVYLVVLTLVMAGALIYGFVVGDFWKDGGELLDNPWGIVSLFDVYVGFFLFIGWICYRESCPGIMLAWSVTILLGGNVVSGLYTVVALIRSKGDAKLFFLGDGKRCCSEQADEA
jgi:hypothetical protein